MAAPAAATFIAQGFHTAQKVPGYSVHSGRIAAQKHPESPGLRGPPSNGKN